MREAHGGRIIERILDKKSAEEIKAESERLSHLELSFDKVQEVVNITTGVFSPLEGFMTEEEYKSVIIRSRLLNNLAWTIPIVLDSSKEEASKLSKKDKVILTFRDKPVAIMEVEDVFNFDKTEYSKSIFDTDSRDHPGVKKVFEMGDILIGGKLSLIQEPENKFYKYTLRPKETRVLFREKGWTDVVGFRQEMSLI